MVANKKGIIQDNGGLQEFISGRLTRAAYDVAEASHTQGLKVLPLPGASLRRSWDSPRPQWLINARIAIFTIINCLAEALDRPETGVPYNN